MSNPAKSIEAKKDEFRSYLEHTGVVDQLTKILVSLYEESEQPENPLEFIKKSINAPDEEDQENLKTQYLKLDEDNRNLKKRIEKLQNDIKELKAEEEK